MKLRKVESLGMRRLIANVAVVSLLAAGVGCAGVAGIGAAPTRASATLNDAQGREIGTIHFTQLGNASAVTVIGRLDGLAPGQHGIHIHTVGKCDSQGAFADAGGHFNPASMKHGLQAQGGPHAGDLENITVAADGHADVNMVTTRITLTDGPNSVFDTDGSALIIHAGPDDNMTDPAGNSGARIVCGVIEKN